MSPEAAVHFANAFAEVLNGVMPGWVVEQDMIRGPEDAAVRFGARHPVSSPGHADVEFSFEDRAADSLRLWDCVVGFGEDLQARARNAATIWGSTSAMALLEFKYSRRGKYADHYMSHEATGLTGWHAICSPIIGWGQGDGGRELQEWWTRHEQVLPALAPALQDLQDNLPHAIKVFLGGQDVAEVRVDGEHHDAASDALLALDWPRQDPASFVRAFVIAIHRE